MAITNIGSNSGNGSAVSSFAIAYPTGYTAVAGDIVIVVCNVNLNAVTYSQTAGPTYTGLGTGGAIKSDFSGGVALSEMVAWRVLATADAAPTFGWVTSGRATWSLIVLRPDSGSAISVDTTAGVSFGSAGTSFTAPSAIAAGSGEASVIVQSFKASANGATAVTWTPPTGWASQVTGSQVGAGSTASNLTGIATDIGVGPGSVAPGATATGVSCIAASASYQLLIQQAASGAVTGGSGRMMPTQAVMRASTW